jgi:Zn-dependent membrane protease YugP
MFFWDYTIFFLIPPMLLALYAQSKVKGTFHKYSRIGARSRISGAQVAREILNAKGAGEVKVEQVSGRLSDHYDPRKKTLRLSGEVYGSHSLAALGVAAHEAGHALQHHSGYAPLHFRNFIYPVAGLGSKLALPLFFIGFIFQREGPTFLMDLGILLFAGAVLFSVITLPVEFNASRRALVLLKDGRYLSGEELQGARKVLSAAALTYVASTAMAVMQLLRLLVLRDRR